MTFFRGRPDFELQKTGRIYSGQSSMSRLGVRAIGLGLGLGFDPFSTTLQLWGQNAWN